jgi:hypothetical protein
MAPGMTAESQLPNGAPTQQVDPLAVSRELLKIPEFDLGVLLVHGIGVQQRSDVLTAAGDEIIGWLRKRVETPPPGDMAVLDVVARQPSGDAIPAAHAVIRITPPEGAGKVVHWVVAEAWWAEVFRAATFQEMLGWVLTIGPWIFASEVADIMRRLEIGKAVPLPLRLVLIPVTLAMGLVMMLGAAILGFAVTLLAAAVFVLTVINVPFLSDAAAGFQRTLASEFGDAYVLTRSPVRFGAMASSVRANLRNLREQCQEVAIVAHSQGTAVAWFALLHELLDEPPASEVPIEMATAFSSQMPPDPPTSEAKPRAPIGLFVTYGQALRKLSFALHLARGSETIRGQAWLALGSTVLAGAAIVAFLVSGNPLIGVLVALAAIGAEAVLLDSASKAWAASAEHIEQDWRDVLRKEPHLEWLDLWASADPATVGPLNIRGRRVRSFKIRNLSSIVADHDVYWRNTTEFLAILGAKLFALGGPQTYARRLTDPVIRVAAMRRHARVMVLMTIRLVLFVGLLAGAAFALTDPDFGPDLVDVVVDLGIPFVSNFVAALPDWVATFAGLIPVLLVWVVAWQLLFKIWSALTAADDKAYFEGTEARLWTIKWPALGALTVVVMAGIAVALNALADQNLALAYVIGSVFLATLGLAVLAGGGRLYAAVERAERTRAAIDRIPLPRFVAWAVVLVPAAVLVVLPIATFARDPALTPIVLAGEAILLSIVFAIEGVREYRVFSTAYTKRNERLPRRPAKRTSKATG